jgi:predicted hotdog family 3-hydroxylacyl-ACP dehydratase
VGLEVGAQAAAALQALMRPPGAGGPRIGYLVGVRAARLAARIEAGRDLRVVAVPTGGAGALAIYEVEVFDVPDGDAGGTAGMAGGGSGEAAGSRRLARATLSTFMTE